jgi:hypothetical protein
VPHILIGNESLVDVIGKNFVDANIGTFEDVLCVPNLSSNLLFVYQITQKGRKLEFTPNFVTVMDLEEMHFLQLVRLIMSLTCIRSLILYLILILFIFSPIHIL